MSLRLRLPTVCGSLDPHLETRRVYVEEWVEGLPYANRAALLGAVQRSLSALNRNPIRYRSRLDLLELHLGPYRHLLELVRGHRAAHGIGGFERQRAETDAISRIATELADGYKLALCDAAGGLRRARRDVTLALQRAVACLCHVVLYSYHEYLPTPPHVWFELSELYRFARTQRLAGETVTAGSAGPDISPCADQHYKSILVTSLVNPYQLVYGDVWNVHAFIMARVRSVDLQAPEPTTRTAGVFYVDPDLDRRPIPYDELDATSGAGLLLNTRGLLASLQRRLDELCPAGAPSAPGMRADPEARLAERVVSTLGRPPVRERRRRREDDRVTVASGLASVHHFVRPERFARPRPPDDAEIEIGDVATGDRAAAAPAYATEVWHRVNRGALGVGIARTTRPAHPLGVGELVGIRQGDTEAWAVGVLRWLNVSVGGSHRAGVELMSGRTVAVEVRSGSDGGAGAAQPALWLSQPSGPATLVLPPGMGRPGRALEVTDASASGATLRLACRTVRETLIGCEVVECSRLGASEDDHRPGERPSSG